MTDQGASGALRLLADGGRVRTWRPAVLAHALAARAGAGRAFALWPDASGPEIAANPGTPAAEWLWETFEHRRSARAGRARAALRRAVGTRTWGAVRAGATLSGARPAWLSRACSGPLDSRPESVDLALYSPSGSPLSKALCFVFEAGRREPAAVAMAMADPSQSGRLRREFQAVEHVRTTLADDSPLRHSLPLAPLAMDEAAGDLVMIVPPDPLAAATGRVGHARALDWLARLRAETTTGFAPWDAQDDRRELEVIERAWTELRPQSVAAVGGATARALASLRGRRVPRGVSHGDFWRGNIAGEGERLRVYDWEWAETEAPPFHDVCTYQLAELAQPSGPAFTLDDAAARVSAALSAQDVDPGFTAPMLCSTLARLAIRIRLATGSAGPAEEPLAALMAPVERLVAP